MLKPQHIDSINTTLKILINEWTALREILHDTTCVMPQSKEKHDELGGLMPLLTDLQFQDALQGPFHLWLKKLINSHALINKMRLYLTATQDDNIKPHINTSNLSLVSSFTPDISAAALDKIQRQLDQVTRTQHQQWLEKNKEWQDQLLLQLAMQDINLSDLEIEAFYRQDPISEILKRYVDLRLELPKQKAASYHFDDYLRLKTILTVHSALSRQHKAHATTDIHAYLKKLKNDFKYIAQQAQQLFSQQEKEIAQLLKN